MYFTFRKFRRLFLEYKHMVSERRAVLQVNDIDRTTIILDFEEYAEQMCKMIEFTGRKRWVSIEYIGNWWVKGNPYKGMNVTYTQTGIVLWWKSLISALWVRGLIPLKIPPTSKFEVQFHTQESNEIARRNHALYEIYRNADKPLELRRNAFDEMVDSFECIRSPVGVEKIGDLITVEKPKPSSSKELLLQFIEEALGKKLTVEFDDPIYPAEMQESLDRARQIVGMSPKLSIALFEEIVNRFEASTELWTKRGVATALVNKGQVLMEMSLCEDAVSTFREVIEKYRYDLDVELEVANAEQYLIQAKGAARLDGPSKSFPEK